MIGVAREGRDWGRRSRATRLTEPKPPRLQNRQAHVAHALVGSTPAPLRSRIRHGYADSRRLVVVVDDAACVVGCDDLHRRAERSWELVSLPVLATGRIARAAKCSVASGSPASCLRCPAGDSAAAVARWPVFSTPRTPIRSLHDPGGSKSLAGGGDSGELRVPDMRRMSVLDETLERGQGSAAEAA
jgi:hypothetical protein